MFVISGATGRVGSVVVRTLLSQHQPVVALSRSGRPVPDAPGVSVSPGQIETLALDLADTDALASELTGANGFFVLLPFDDTLANPDRAEQLIESVARAVERSGVGHVVLLSSGGADVPPGGKTPTGPIADLHRFEQRLAETGATTSALRCCHFQEKFTDTLDSVRLAGVLPVLASTAHRPLPMVATADVGRIVAETLLNPLNPPASQVIDISGPEYTEAEVAAVLGRALRRAVHAECVPESEWHYALTSAGLTDEAASELAAMYRADEAGMLAPRAPLSRVGETALSATVEKVLGDAQW